MGVATAVVLGISAAVTAGSAYYGAREEKKLQAKGEVQASKRHTEELALRKQLASQAMAPVTKTGGRVELQSVSAKEDAAIRKRAGRSRLRVERKSGGGSVGTGLSI